jgi:hypothetical protein
MILHRADGQESSSFAYDTRPSAGSYPKIIKQVAQEEVMNRNYDVRNTALCNPLITSL